MLGGGAEEQLLPTPLDPQQLIGQVIAEDPAMGTRRRPAFDFNSNRGQPSEMMVNFTPLKASTNRSIGKVPPSQVTANVRWDPDALVKHRIDRKAFEEDQVEDFVAARIKGLSNSSPRR
jgi:hypothetical protein